MIYAIPYIVFFLFILVLGIITEQRKDDVELCRKVKLFGVLSFVLFFGFRGYIWHDWTSYYIYHEDRTWSDFLEYDYFEHREPGWLLFDLVLKTLGFTYPMLQITVTLLSTFLLVRFLRRYTDNFLLALAAFLAMNGYVLSINLMRNSLAILIFLNALDFLRNRQFWPYFGMCLLSVSLHFSSLIFLPLYFILHLRLNKWVFLLLVIVCHLALFVGFSPIMTIAAQLFEDNAIVAQKVESYTDYGWHGMPITILLQRLITCGMVFCFYETLMQRRSTNRIIVNSLLVYMLSTALTYDIVEVSNRLGIIFSYANWVILIELVFCLKYVGNRCLFAGYFVLFFIFRMLVTINTPVNEYQNYLLGNVKTYQQSLDHFNKTFKEPDQ
ncbi:MAG: EpsG family protein [Bacteroidales bacterium]|nr:EpsG family protein [Bacteroidales bacterium]